MYQPVQSDPVARYRKLARTLDMHKTAAFFRYGMKPLPIAKQVADPQSGLARHLKEHVLTADPVKSTDRKGSHYVIREHLASVLAGRLADNRTNMAAPHPLVWRPRVPAPVEAEAKRLFGTPHTQRQVGTNDVGSTQILYPDSLHRHVVAQPMTENGLTTHPQTLSIFKHQVGNHLSKDNEYSNLASRLDWEKTPARLAQQKQLDDFIADLRKDKQAISAMDYDDGDMDLLDMSSDKFWAMVEQLKAKTKPKKGF